MASGDDRLRAQDRTVSRIASFAPESAAEARDAKPAEITLSFDDNGLASLVFGHYDQNIAKIERRLGVAANANGNHVTIKGPEEACEHARRVFENLYARAKLGQPLSLGDVEGAIQEGALQGNLFTKDEGATPAIFDQI